MNTHFVVGASSPLAQKKQVTLEELVRQNFILTEKGMGYRGVLDKHLERLSLEIQPVLEISRTDIITKLVENGNCVSFLPDFVTKSRVEKGKLFYLDVEGFEIDPIWQQLIYHKNKWISRALGTFIDYAAAHPITIE